MLLIAVFIFLSKIAESKSPGYAPPTKFHFKPTINCTLGLKGTWCIQVWGLEDDIGIFSSNYDELGKTERICQPFSKTELALHFEGGDTHDYGGSFEVVVGYRHNCTVDGGIKEFVSKIHDLPGDMYRPQVVSGNALLDDHGTPKADGKWTSRKFMGYEIEVK
ncbi:unnamed protein product [Caenorhabditis angaria]|uniref:Uncharacterized protein n=1 Tax=Caenorhabditis angaria TaxID=860376 RepID=A0A9P1N478_9PELO|nr:unnamed protein product [Caenorhabditis angaria]